MFWVFVIVFINEDVYLNVYYISFEILLDKFAILKCKLILFKNYKR